LPYIFLYDTMYRIYNEDINLICLKFVKQFFGTLIYFKSRNLFSYTNRQELNARAAQTKFSETQRSRLPEPEQYFEIFRQMEAVEI
jgi:hypothetical protein